MSQSGGFFEGMSSKASFVMGLLGGLCVAFAVGFFIVSSGDGVGSKVVKDSGTVAGAPAGNQAPPAQQPTGTPPEVTKDDRVLGPDNAKVTIIEFSDIQCPFCQRFHPTVERIIEEYGDDVRWVYKHFPLDSIHPNARSAAEASECLADLQGDEAFFAYLNLLFGKQQNLNRATYIADAVALGANQSKFEKCLDDGTFKAKVEADYQEGIKGGVRGTPGSYINDTYLSGAQPYEQVKAAVESYL
jgi:protein-disulfide isomerase